MSHIKSLLDDMNEHFYAHLNRAELHWMEQEFEQSKRERNEGIHQIEVEAEIVTGEEATQKSTPEMGGDRYNESEIFNHQPIITIRDERHIGGGVLSESQEQGNTPS